MNQKKYIAFFFSLLFACQYFSAQNYQKIYNDLEERLLRFKASTVISEVDSLLFINRVPDSIINDLKSLKVEALAEYSFFTKALELSNEVLSSKNILSERAEVRIRIQRALIFEVFENSKETLFEFKKLEKIYNTRKKDRYYGQYLFRKSSYYRVLKPVEKSDSIGLVYAIKAAKFGDFHNYYDVSAIAKMLQSFFLDKKDYKKRSRFLQAALKDFKLLGNPLSVSLMYTSLSRISLKNNELEKSKKYLDSALYEAKITDDLFLRSYTFKQRSIFFESIKQKDSALFYFKKFYEAEMGINFEKQKLEVADINLKNQIQIQKQAVINSKAELLITKKNNNYLILFSIGAFILIVIIFILYRRLNKKNKVIFSRNEKLRKSIEEKKILLKELNHRVKNNLSLIISLIKFQSQEVDDNFFKEKFKQLENRINTIAIAHEQFVYSDKEIEGKFYNLEEYLQKISDSLINLSIRRIKFKQSIEDIQLNIDTALPIGILMNELISNSIEHAVSNDVLEIRISIEFKSDKILITYFDSGNIFKTVENREGLGLFIIESMIAQLDGKLEREGSTFKIILNHKN